jgi:hypothetical protein
MVGSTPSERSFGFSVGGVLVALAAWSWWSDSRPLAAVLVSVGILLIACAAAAPSLLQRPGRIWFRIAHVIGWINSRILLGVFFAVVITPAGLLMRAAGRNPLRGGRGTTNWTRYPDRIGNPHHFDRLF